MSQTERESEFEAEVDSFAICWCLLVFGSYQGFRAINGDAFPTAQSWLFCLILPLHYYFSKFPCDCWFGKCFHSPHVPLQQATVFFLFVFSWYYHVGPGNELGFSQSGPNGPCLFTVLLTRGLPLYLCTFFGPSLISKSFVAGWG